jgi:plastocyanin
MNNFMNYKYILLVLILAGALVGGWFYMNKEKEMAPAKSFDPSLVTKNDVVIIQKADAFYPSEVTIKKGTRVVWINESGNFIWPASDLHPTHEAYPGFDPEEPIDMAKAWGFTFEKVGNWNFHDHLKPNRRGVVHVTE